MSDAGTRKSAILLMSLGEDRAAALEPRQCFAQRDLADAELGRQGILADRQIVRQSSGHDLLAHGNFGIFRQPKFHK